VPALADHASFRKASKALGISRPAPTEGPFRIERELGQRRFDRHGQAIAPTVFGAIVVDRAPRMLDPGFPR
jgi:DNA-binding transcriptional LysR family regulator